MLIGLAVLIGRFRIHPAAGTTVLAQLTEASLGRGAGFYVVQISTTVLLALAANPPDSQLPAPIVEGDSGQRRLVRIDADRDHDGPSSVHQASSGRSPRRAA